MTSTVISLKLFGRLPDMDTMCNQPLGQYLTLVKYNIIFLGMYKYGIVLRHSMMTSKGINLRQLICLTLNLHHNIEGILGQQHQAICIR